MHTLEIAFNTFGSNTLGKDDCATLDRPAYEELGRRFAEPFGRADDDGVVDGSVIVSSLALMYDWEVWRYAHLGRL
jgi:hypothetical protein